MRKSMVLIVLCSALWMPGMSMACVDPAARMQTPCQRADQRIQPITSYEFPNLARLAPAGLTAARLVAFRTTIDEAAALQAAKGTAPVRRL